MPQAFDPRELIRKIAQTRLAMQAAMGRLRDAGDRAFAETLDRAAFQAAAATQRAIDRFRIDPSGRILADPDNLAIRVEALRQIKKILDFVNRAIRSEDHPTFATMQKAAETAIDYVRRSVRYGTRQGITSDPPAAVWHAIEAQAVGPAWDNVGRVMRRFSENLYRKVGEELVQGVLVGRTREQLRQRFETLTRTAEQLAKRQHSDEYYRNRSRTQVRGELTRVYTQTTVRSANRIGFQLFEHFGPVDARNVTDIVAANDRGSIDERWRGEGSQDFIGKVLSAQEWEQISPRWNTYGLHYNERGGFQPVMIEWPGIEARWRASQRALGFVGPV